MGKNRSDRIAYCKRCGFPNLADSNFCGRCGLLGKQILMMEMGKDKVYLVFVEKVNQELFDESIRKIMGVFGEDASSWFKPVNGYENLER